MRKHDELEKLAKPLQEWLLKNYCLESIIIIESDFVRVLSTEMGSPLKFEDK